MDFSTIPRALESLHRRQPSLPTDVLGVVTQLQKHLESSDDASASSSQLLVALLGLLKTTTTTTNGDGTTDNNADASLKKERWEPLAVGLFISTEILNAYTTVKATGDATAASQVYMDGPRVPDAVIVEGTASVEALNSSVVSSSDNCGSLLLRGILCGETNTSNSDIDKLCTTLHSVCMDHLEHPEPRVRTLVAKTVGAYCRTLESWTASSSSNDDNSVLSSIAILQEMHSRLTSSLHDHIDAGRDEMGNYSRASCGAIDDTTGWRALETNWLCLAAMINSMGSSYLTTFPFVDQPLQDATLSMNTSTTLLDDCEFSAVTHVNRHVRAAAMQCLEQWVHAVSDLGQKQNMEEDGGTSATSMLMDSKLKKTIVAVLKTGLADNWSQVRMAASVLARVFFVAVQNLAGPAALLQDKMILAALVPRMCLNRFYLAQGVKLYSHETWKLVFQDGTGLDTVVSALPAICRYYVKMCDADNHVVREAACQAVAELAVRIGENTSHRCKLETHLEMLLQALLMCFHDESWPVRDEACLACGLLCKSYPKECKPEFKVLWERWTEQLTDQIWSVREDAAVALGDALEAYGEEVLTKLLDLIKKILPAARDQPAMTAAEYKAHVNDMEQHENSQLYSCGSLAPKLQKTTKKAGAGRIGCTNCGIDRPKAPWEATDGCIYLIRVLVEQTCQNDETSSVTLDDATLLPILQELADVCRVQHFPQSNDLRATLWKNVPAMAVALGKARFKRTYLEVFMDLLFRNLDSRSASALSQHAAGQCMEELADLVGRSIFRGRLDEYQQRTYDATIRDRAAMPKGPGGDAAVFSPFGPPGLLDMIKR